DEGFSDPVPVVKFTTLCYEKAPEAAGFDRQFHDFRYDDIKEKEHWHWWPTDPTVIVYDNADRFRSTDANGFYLKYFYVHQGSKCFP
ncbi:MAG: hypothetical protein JWL82_360, partial [Parcubacteria group bacterium]|nr:hypothetical protein [Parcubacteria group bacterium]